MAKEKMKTFKISEHDIPTYFFTVKKAIPLKMQKKTFFFQVTTTSNNLSGKLLMIDKMIADHDRDLIVQDFEKVIVSELRSQFGKSIVSDRRSRKM